MPHWKLVWRPVLLHINDWQSMTCNSELKKKKRTWRQLECKTWHSYFKINRFTAAATKKCTTKSFACASTRWTDLEPASHDIIQLNNEEEWRSEVVCLLWLMFIWTGHVVVEVVLRVAMETVFPLSFSTCQAWRMCTCLMSSTYPLIMMHLLFSNPHFLHLWFVEIRCPSV